MKVSVSVSWESETGRGWVVGKFAGESPRWVKGGSQTGGQPSEHSAKRLGGGEGGGKDWVRRA